MELKKKEVRRKGRISKVREGVIESNSDKSEKEEMTERRKREVQEDKHKNEKKNTQSRNSDGRSKEEWNAQTAKIATARGK